MKVTQVCYENDKKTCRTIDIVYIKKLLIAPFFARVGVCEEHNCKHDPAELIGTPQETASVVALSYFTERLGMKFLRTSSTAKVNVWKI